MDTSLKKCEFCGKEYFKKTYNILGIDKIMQFPQCTCLEELRKKEQEEKEKQKKRDILERKFQNSLITPFFREKTFKNIDFSKEKAICQKYANEFEPQKSKGISLIGSVGTGKTTLLACICNDLIPKGYNCLFTQLSDLLDKFVIARRSKNELAESNLMYWLLQFDFVVLDDIGREKYTETRLEIAFKIIDKLLNHKIPVAFSANPEMIEKLKNIADYRAILDRLNEMSAIKLTFKGESYRGKTNKSNEL